MKLSTLWDTVLQTGLPDMKTNFSITTELEFQINEVIPLQLLEEHTSGCVTWPFSLTAWWSFRLFERSTGSRIYVLFVSSTVSHRSVYFIRQNVLQMWTTKIELRSEIITLPQNFMKKEVRISVKLKNDRTHCQVVKFGKRKSIWDAKLIGECVD